MINDYNIYYCLCCIDSGCSTCQKINRFSQYKDNKMTDKAKKLILEANDHMKAAAKNFEELYTEIELHPDLIQNANIAFGELVKCIKHVSLIQGDITGKELMTPLIFEKISQSAKVEKEKIEKIN